MISTGQPFSSTEELFMLGTLPSRGSSGVTRRSRSPRNLSTTTPKRWLRSLATTTGKRPFSLGVTGSSSTCGRLDQAHRLIVQQHVRLPLQLDHIMTVEHQDLVDPVERKGVRLAGDLHQQGTDDRNGDR